MTTPRSLHALIARVPAHGTADFDAYEAAVLPLLLRHGGRLERRLRHRDVEGSWVEVHVVSFADETGLGSYRADPDRARHAGVLERSGARMELLRVEDLAVPS